MISATPLGRKQIFLVEQTMLADPLGAGAQHSHDKRPNWFGLGLWATTFFIIGLLVSSVSSDVSLNVVDIIQSVSLRIAGFAGSPDPTLTPTRTPTRTLTSTPTPPPNIELPKPVGIEHLGDAKYVC